MTKKFQLKNGMTVILIESHKSPVVSTQMWVKTGSADEAPKEAGISHFIEHLVFKGTDHYSVGEIASTVEASGGELNAYTSFDQTVFYVTISTEFKEVAMDVISQMMGFPQFDPQEIDNEREVVIEEIKRGQDSPGRVSSQLLFSQLFKKHPYGRPVIGFDKIIRTVSVKKIREYYNSRYVPRNMTLVVAGDFNSKEMKDLVQKYFSHFVDYKLKSIKRPKEKFSKKNEIKVTKTSFNQNSIYFSWHGPNIKHKDVAALEVLSSILGQSETSRLIKALRIDKAVVNSVGAFSYPMQDHGLIAVSCSLELENLSETLDILAKELSKFIKHGPSHEEMQRAITNIAANEFYSVETVDNLARKAGSYHFYLNDHEYFKKYIKQIYTLTPDDIRKIAAKYLDPKSVKISMACKDGVEQNKKELKKFIKTFSNELNVKEKRENTKSFKPSKLKIGVSGGVQKQNVIEEIKMKNGLSLILKPQRESPSVVAKIAMLGGLRSEDSNLGGSTELLSRLWGAGTKKLNETEIGKILEDHAAGLGAFGGRNSVGLSMECLRPFEQKIGDLFGEVILEPKFENDILKREVTILNNQIAKRNDNPAQICMMNFQEEIFKNHPYSRDPLGSLESISKMQTTNLSNLLKKVSSAENTSLCIVGDFSEKYWLKLAEQIDLELGKKGRLNQSIPMENLAADVVKFSELKKEQSHIVVGYRGLSLFDKDRFALEIIQSILSGQGGRLFLELRDKNSLAYSVSPISLNGFDGGYFGGYIGCSPDKGAKAIEMLQKEFLRLADEKISEAELKRAQRYLIGRHDIELQRKSAICNAMLFDQIYGFDPRKSLSVAEDYFAVSQNDILQLAERIFKAPKAISIVGPFNPLKG